MVLLNQTLVVIPLFFEKRITIQICDVSMNRKNIYSKIRDRQEIVAKYRECHGTAEGEVEKGRLTAVLVILPIQRSTSPSVAP